MTAIITCSIEDATFESHFAIDKGTPEYMIADAQEMVLSFWESAAYDSYLFCLGMGYVYCMNDFDDDIYIDDFGYFKTSLIDKELP